MDEHEKSEESSLESSFDEDSPESPQPPPVDPVVGIMDPDDTLELLRDALRQGQGLEHIDNLTMSERANLTAHSALQPYSYDMHVRLGMELMALRRQEANQKLDAEAFGAQLQRRAYVRDMLKRVAKEDNWVQYPASDLERITRALNRSTSKATEEAAVKAVPGPTVPSYAKWLERRRKPLTTRRTAFGSTLVPAKKPPKSRSKAAQEVVPPKGAADSSGGGDGGCGDGDGGGSSDGGGGSNNGGGDGGDEPMSAHSSLLVEAGMDESEGVAVTSFGLAARLMGPVNSRRSLCSGGVGHLRPTDVTRIRIQSRGGPRFGLSAAIGSVTLSGDINYGDGRIGAAVSTIGSVNPFADAESQAFAVRFQDEDDDSEEELEELEDAAEMLGLGGGHGCGGRQEGRRGRSHGGARGKAQAEQEAAEAAAAAAAAAEADKATSRLGWRAVLKRNRAAAASTAAAAPDGGATEEELAANPLLALRMSVRRELSHTASMAAKAEMDLPPVEDAVAAAEPPLRELETPLDELEGAVQALTSIGDDQLQAFARAVEAEEAVDAAVDAADAAAKTQVEAWAEATAAQLAEAAENYGMAHAAKLEHISCVADIKRQLFLLRDWIDDRKAKRLTAAAVALTAQRERLSAAVGGAAAGNRSRALTALLEGCGAAAEELGGLAAAVEAAAVEAAAALADREARRQALRLIEDECVQLAEEMAAREETDRLADLMRAEAEAQRRLAEAKSDEEARRHALLAATLMGQQEWLLEKEARQAAMRAAERDERRLRVLRGAEEDKARQAEAAGWVYDRVLLQELVELEEAARREAAVRQEGLQEALTELAHFEEMLRRQKRESEAAAALAAVAPPQPADASPEALVRAALAAARECVNKAVTEAEAVAGQAPAEAPAQGAADGRLQGSAGAGENSELHRAARAAQARMAAARAGLEVAKAEAEAEAAVRRAPSAAAGIVAAAAEATPPAPNVRPPPLRTESLASRHAAMFREVRQEVRGEQDRLATVMTEQSAVLRGRSRQLLETVAGECEELAKAVAEAEAAMVAMVAAEEDVEAAAAATLADASPSPSSRASSNAGNAVMAAAAEPPSPSPSPPQQPLPQPLSPLSPTPRPPQLPVQPPASPSGVLAPPVVRARASGPGIAPSPAAALAASPRSQSPARDWGLLRPDATAGSSLGRDGHGGGGSGGGSGLAPGTVVLGVAIAPPPPSLPAVHPRSGGGGPAVRAGGGLSAKALQAQQQPQQPRLTTPLQHPIPGGLAAPYGRGSPAQQHLQHSHPPQHPHPHQQPPPHTHPHPHQQHQPQVVLPAMYPTPTDIPGSGPRARGVGVLVHGRAGLGPAPGAPGSSSSPELQLPPIGSHPPTGAAPALAVGLVAPPPSRSNTSDGSGSDGAAVATVAATAATLIRVASPPGVSPLLGRPGAQPSPRQQQYHQHQQQPQQPHPNQQHKPAPLTLWPGAATAEHRRSRSLPASPDPAARTAATATTARSPAASPPPRGGRGAAPATKRQGAVYNTKAMSATESSPGAQVYGNHQSHAQRRQEPALAGAGGTGSDTGGSARSTSSSPQRGAPHATMAPAAAAAAPPPPPPPTSRASPSTFSLGDVSYSQWISSRSPYTLSPPALDAARRVDEALARLPPELHSLMLNAAEILSLEKGGYELGQMQPEAVAAAAAANGVGGGAVPPHLQSLPAVVSRYILSQMQRIYSHAVVAVAGGSGSGGGDSGRSSGVIAAQAPGGGGGGADAFENFGLKGQPSLAALELLNQLLPTVAQSIAQLRMNGGGSGSSAAAGRASGTATAAAAGAAAAAGFEPSRSPIGTGAMHGSPLKSKRRSRSQTLDSGDGGSGALPAGSSAVGAAAAPTAQIMTAAATGWGLVSGGVGQGPSARHHVLSMSTQSAHPGGGKPGAGSGGTGGGNPRRGLTCAVQSGKGGGAGGDKERWMIRGMNVQTGAQPQGPPPQQQQPQPLPPPPHHHHPQQQQQVEGAVLPPPSAPQAAAAAPGGVTGADPGARTAAAAGTAAGASGAGAAAVDAPAHGVHQPAPPPPPPRCARPATDAVADTAAAAAAAAAAGRPPLPRTP